MDRRADFLQYIADETPEDIEGVYAEIFVDFQDNREAIIAGFMSALESAIKQCVVLQEQGQKGPIESILISPTYYGVCTGSYELVISVFDERMYFDRGEAMAYWQADFVYKYVDIHMPIFAQSLKKKFIRLKDYELDEIRQMYACLYHQFLYHPLLLITKDIEEIPVYKAARKQPEVRLLYGYYMDKYIELRKISSGVQV